MLHACAARFDMTKNLKKFTKFFRTKHPPGLRKILLIINERNKIVSDF